jgi:hypothetical protein
LTCKFEFSYIFPIILIEMPQLQSCKYSRLTSSTARLFANCFNNFVEISGMKKGLVGLIFVVGIVLGGNAQAQTSANADTFILSNEALGNFIHMLINGGDGKNNLYQVLVAFQSNADPSIAGILNPVFLATLHSCPASSDIFTTKLRQHDGRQGRGLAISTDCTLQYTSYQGAYYSGSSGTTTLATSISGIGNADVISSSTQSALATWQKTSNGTTTTYKAFAIGVAPPCRFAQARIDSSLNPSSVGQTVTFTGAVGPQVGGGTPTGTVQFYADLIPLGSPVVLTNGSAIFATPILPAGNYSIRAAYSGDNTFHSASAMLYQKVQGSSTIHNSIILSNEAPGNFISRFVNAGYGDYNLYDFLIALSASSDPSISDFVTDAFLNTLASCPAGSAIFTTKLNQYAISSDAAAVSDDCTVQDTGISGNYYYLLPMEIYSTQGAEYSGVGRIDLVRSARKEIENSYLEIWTPVNGGSAATYRALAVIWMTKRSTSISVTSSENPATLGQLVTFTAQVVPESGSDVPAGSVYFYVDGAPFNQSGTAAGLIIARSFLSVGSHTISVAYSGQASGFDDSNGKLESGEIVLSNAKQSNSFILSNEAPGYFINKLINAGYIRNVSGALSNIQRSCNPDCSKILTSEFITMLGAIPGSSAVNRTLLNQYNIAGKKIAIADDGTIQTVAVNGSAFSGQTGYGTLATNISGVGAANIVYPTDSGSFITAYGGGATTYYAVAEIYGAEATNPAPTVTSMQPSSTLTGSGAFTLTVNGKDFVNGAVVSFGGVNHATSFVNATQVTASILAGDVATSYAPPVIVTNPSPGGGASNTVSFAITDFRVGSGTTSQTVKAGQSGAFTITTSSDVGSLPGAITFSTAGLPQGASATFAPASVASGTNTAMTIATTQRSSMLGPIRPLDPRREIFLIWIYALGAAMGLAAARIAVQKKPIRPLARMAMFCCVAIAFCCFSGCGSGSSSKGNSSKGTPAGTFPIAVTGSSGALSHSTTVTLIVR